MFTALPPYNIPPLLPSTPMADLPPRAPSSTLNHKFSSTRNLAPNEGPTWVDEFLDFAASRRGSHRRSMSDSVTFVEFDDEHFLSMFADEPRPAVGSNPSTPSDQSNAIVKTEAEEVDSKPTVEKRIVDPRRVKRILANRQSAQRSRVRKLQYISDLERSVTSLQTEVSLLSPRVAFLDQQRLLLNVDNSALKQRIASLAQDKIFKDAHQEALKTEINRLRKVYEQQHMRKEGNTILLHPPIVPMNGAIEQEPLLNAQ